MPNPIDAKLKIQELAQLAVKAAKERFDTQLDYSKESLVALDRMLAMAQQTFDKQRVEGMLSEDAIIRTSRIWGSYYGELIRKRWDGQWIVEGTEVLLKVGDHVVNPIAEINHNINYHPRSSIIDHYTRLDETLSPSSIPLPAFTESSKTLTIDGDPYAVQPTWVQAIAGEQPISTSQDAKELEQKLTLLEQVRQRLKEEQNLPLGIAAGAMTGLVGSILWALITFFTEYQIGWMATGIGILIGWTMRIAGRGIDKIFGVAGAVLALLSIILGNILAAALILAKIQAVSFIDVLISMLLQPGLVLEVLGAMILPIDLLFYILGLLAGYWYAFRRISLTHP